MANSDSNGSSGIIPIIIGVAVLIFIFKGCDNKQEEYQDSPPERQEWVEYSNGEDRYITPRYYPVNRQQLPFQEKHKPKKYK